MNPILTSYASALRLGEAQAYKNMGIFPVFTSVEGGPEYLTLKEALDGEQIVITEVDEGGTVPELKVVNRSDRYVLLFDGEELMGSKQNRVLNTSILLAGHSELVVPVSCTEMGRWGYTSRSFMDSESISTSRLRSLKASSVTRSLRAKLGHRSDQGEIWADIAALHADAKVQSPTSALRDVYSPWAETLEAYGQAFPCLPGQQGALVTINGQVVGLDLLSRPAAYAMIHAKLARSYAMEAAVGGNEQADGTSEDQTGRPSDDETGHPSVDRAEAFLQALQSYEVQEFPAVGVGQELRFEGPQAVGSALVLDAHVIHLMGFRPESSEYSDRMASYRLRRDLMMRAREGVESETDREVEALLATRE